MCLLLLSTQFTPVIVAESESAVNQRHHSVTLFPSVRFALTMQLFHGTERLNKDLTFEPQHSKGRNDNLQDRAFDSLGHNDSLLSWQFECTAKRTEMTGFFICSWVSFQLIYCIQCNIYPFYLERSQIAGRWQLFIQLSC